MWFLIDESGEKVSEFFPSQAKLAVFMQMTPQTFNRAIQKGKNVFQFRGQDVKVVQQTIPHFAVFGFPPGETPIATFELISEVAKWLKVSNQTVHAAVKRGDETKLKNSEGTVFWLKKLETEPPAELGVKKVPPAGPSLLPPKPIPPGPPPPPETVLASPPIPPEVAEVLAAGKTFPFETSRTITINTLDSATTVARFIKSGIKGKMVRHGLVRDQTFLWNGKIIFLPDLVKEIIVFHIREQMWKDGDKAAAEAFLEKTMEYNFQFPKIKDWISAAFLANVRKLDDEVIIQICKELRKLI